MNNGIIISDRILYEDDDLIAINKPHGLLVHRSRIAADATEFALQLVRNYVGVRVYPAHRLDRKTSGVLLFSKSKNANQEIQSLFRDRKVHKEYEAIVRGHIDHSGLIDYALTNENKLQEAETSYSLNQHFEIPVPFGRFDTSRYSLVTLLPRTGRYHQLRKHMKHVFHPILGDRPHGCNKQNKLWKEKYNMTTMMLHASKLNFEYPVGNPISIVAYRSHEFTRVIDILNQENKKKE